MRERHPNRTRTRAAKVSTQKQWCAGCDARLVKPTERCPNCGNKEHLNRDKKATRPVELEYYDEM